MATRNRSESATAGRAKPAQAAATAPKARATKPSAAKVPVAKAPVAKARKGAGATAAAQDAQQGAGSKAEGLLRAGLRALDNVRHDVQRRQANVVESLLGIAPGGASSAGAAGEAPRRGLVGLPGLDAFGLRKFEDVFDQRVAAALERLGMPTREDVQALQHKLDQVLAQLERLQPPTADEAPVAAARPRSARKPSPAPKAR